MDKNTNTFDYGINIIYLMPLLTSVGGVMVSIDAFQALDPGSIPGHRNCFIFFFQIATISITVHNLQTRILSPKKCHQR